jgi:hypothetical protein
MLPIVTIGDHMTSLWHETDVIFLFRQLQDLSHARKKERVAHAKREPVLWSTSANCAAQVKPTAPGSSWDQEVVGAYARQGQHDK